MNCREVERLLGKSLNLKVCLCSGGNAIAEKSPSEKKQRKPQIGYARAQKKPEESLRAWGGREKITQFQLRT